MSCIFEIKILRYPRIGIWSILKSGKMGYFSINGGGRGINGKEVDAAPKVNGVMLCFDICSVTIYNAA